MRKLGRCGRQRRAKQFLSQDIPQAHLPQYVRLLQWMKSRLTKCRCSSKLKHNLEPADFKDTGRGLRATKNIHPGETIISIPSELLITTETVFASDIGLLILTERQHFTPQQLLTIFLIFEKHCGTASSWYPYIETLPHIYNTVVYFSCTEIELLSPRAKTLALLNKERFNKALERIQEFIKQCAPTHQSKFNESDVRWAWSTINTRSVYLETPSHPLLILDDEESHVALAPFLDLLNHKDLAQVVAGFNKQSGCYEIVTHDAYKRNAQVFICYGAHDNAKLLVEYGFTLPNNVNNCYTFTMDYLTSHLNGKIRHLDRKIAIINEAQFNKNLVCTIDGVSWSLITALRIMALNWEQLSVWKLLIQDIHLPKDVDEFAHEMARSLVGSVLLMAETLFELIEKQPHISHFDQLISLARDDVQILEKAWVSLQNH